MIALDENGNFIVDSNNHLKLSANSPLQNFKSEVRCIQNSWNQDPTYGRNEMVWTLSQSIQDRCEDLYRIGSKYMPVSSVLYDSTTQQYVVQ